MAERVCDQPHGSGFKESGILITEDTHHHFLTQALLKEHSKAQAEVIRAWVGEDAEKFSALMQLLLGPELKLAQRAAWPLGWIGDAEPHRFLPFFEPMLAALKDPLHPAIPRAIWRTFTLLDIPEDWHGETLELAYQYLQDPQCPIASRVHAMQVAYDISLKYPELKPELAMVIEAHLPDSSAGFRSRGKKLLASLRK